MIVKYKNIFPPNLFAIGQEMPESCPAGWTRWPNNGPTLWLHVTAVAPEVRSSWLSDNGVNLAAMNSAGDVLNKLFELGPSFERGKQTSKLMHLQPFLNSVLQYISVYNVKGCCFVYF